jgi:hypothetical protein
VTNYYALLELPRTASPDDIKKAFRREIARYHPDKVHHLGKEFQEIALAKAAELTLAYKTLTDPAGRAEYDALLDESAPEAGAAAPPSASGPAAPSVAAPPPETPLDAPPGGGTSFFARERAGAMDLGRRATLARFRQALDREFGSVEQRSVPGFEISCVPRAGGLFARRTPPAILGRFLPQVDASAVTETWGMAAKTRPDAQRETCVFLMGPAVAPPGELAVAIAEQRRRPVGSGGKVVIIPVNTQNWHAHVPTDAPPVVKALIARLRSA